MGNSSLFFSMVFTLDFLANFIKITFIFCLVRNLHKLIRAGPNYLAELIPFLNVNRTFHGYANDHLSVDFVRFSFVVSGVFNMYQEVFERSYLRSK